MKITMLGTGHATVTNCYNTCFTISENNKHFLVDAGGGNGILKQLKDSNIKPADIVAMFISHTHTDHIMGAVWIIRVIGRKYLVEDYKTPFNIYGNNEVISAIRKMCEAVLPQKWNDLFEDKIILNVVDTGVETNILNKKIEDIKILYPKIIDDDQEEFVQTLKNKTFKEIDRVAFISHLRMEGKYQICKKGDILSKHDHVIFVLDEGMELRYNDVRKFGRMKLVDHDDYKNQLPLSKLGPEPFEIDYLELYQKLKKKNKAIKTVLLDQSIMTGIGNIYANEICYQMHLNPYTKANVLSKKRVKELVDVACEILNKAILQGGTTIHSFSANGIDGLFQVQLKVHMQKHCPLGHEIKKVMINERGTYYCPICQKAKR